MFLLVGCAGKTSASPDHDAGAADTGVAEVGPPVDAGVKDQSTSDVVDDDAGVDAARDVAPPQMTLAPPIFNPPGPTAIIPQSSAIFLTPSVGSPAGTEIFYTVNGPSPTPQNGSLYAGPISLLEGGNVAAIEAAPG
jgi:hypothetical protein